MPTELIPIVPPSMDESEIGKGEYSTNIINGYLDDNGVLLRRPGLVEVCDLSTGKGVDGLYWWKENNILIAMSGGDTFKITTRDGTYSQLTNGTGAGFENNVRVILDEDSYAGDTFLIGANGGGLQFMSSSAVGNLSTAYPLAPQASTHVTVLDHYVIANEVGTGNFHWSDVANPFSWTANQAEAEARNDELVAVAMADLQLFLLGNRSIEVWHDDGVTPFTRLYQGYVESGTISPYSFTRCDNAWYWLDENRNVVTLSGKTPRRISKSIDKYITGFDAVTDCLGDYIIFDGRPFYVLQFKTAKETLALDLSNGYWYTWTYWDNGEHNHWRGNCSAYCPDWNMMFVGDHSNGKIYKLDNTDYQDDGNILKTEIITPTIDRGILEKRKNCHTLTFYFERTHQTDETGSKEIVVRYRDDGSTTWSGERTLSLAQIGDTNFRIKTDVLGSYYTRQWNFYTTDNAPLGIRKIEESYT
jgi:hypothetical protein